MSHGCYRKTKHNVRDRLQRRNRTRNARAVLRVRRRPNVLLRQNIGFRQLQ